MKLRPTVLSTCLFALLAVLAAATPAAAQSLQDIERAEANLVSAWEKTPLGIRRVLFVTERPPLFGAYEERPNNVFKPGEHLLTYAEPIGYVWTPSPKGFGVNMTLDFAVKTTSGKLLGGQEALLKFAIVSHARVRELMMNVDLNLTGVAPGDYVVDYTLHDLASGKSATFRQDFRIAE